MKFEKNSESAKRHREIQCLINVVEPDPVWQIGFVSDEDSLNSLCCIMEESLMLARLRSYFSENFDFDLDQPIWRLVDQLKVAYLEWPERKFNY